MPKYTVKEANELLPQKPTQSIIDPASLVYLGIAPPKFGKTTWFNSIPDALLLAFERGHAFQKGFKIGIKDWGGRMEVEQDEEGVRYMTMEMVSEILETSDRFSFIIFDTADMAAKLCSDYHCKRQGWNHLTDGGDYGKGYDIGQNTPFRQMVGRIMRTGRGIGFITHSQVNTSKFKKGDVAKKETTLPGGIYKFLHSQADVILHGQFGNKGNRIWQTVGDDETLAGNRMRDINIPTRFIVDNKDPWKQWCSFFKDPKAAAAAEKAVEQLSLKSQGKQADAGE